MTVKALKLTTSEELIAEIVSETDNKIVIKNVVVIALQQMADGRTGMGFMPFMPYLGKDKSITFERNHVMVLEEVDDQMKNQYNSVFGGIVVPPKQLITG